MLGPKVQDKAALELLSRCGGPAGLRKAGRRKLVVATSHAPEPVHPYAGGAAPAGPGQSSPMTGSAAGRHPRARTPPAGWKPDPAWGPAPPGWQLWVDEEIPLFGARGKARELAAENGELQKKLTAWHAQATRLQGELDGRQGELTQLRGEHDRLQSEMRRLGQMAAFELEQYRDRLTQQTAELEQRVGTLSQQVVVTEETVLLQEAGCTSTGTR